MDHQDAARRDSVAWAAQVALAGWQRRVGEPGRAAMRTCPALLAQVDQHAADVREALADDRGDFTVLALAAYADGVADVAAVRGSDLARLAETVDWPQAPWPLVRLLAVCLLAGPV